MPLKPKKRIRRFKRKTPKEELLLTKTAGNADQTDVTLENAETRMSNFIKYYKGIEIVPEEEWKFFFESMFTDFPLTFRICENHRKFINIFEGKPGTISQAEALRDFFCNKLLPQVEGVKVDEKPFEVSPLPWFPKQLGWKCNASGKSITSVPELAPLRDFLFSEEKQTFVFRQEVASMIPILLVDISPNHKVLEMCCAPGFQTTQIVEAMHSNPKKMPEGFLVCNDIETNRINFRWWQCACTFFLHEDAKKFPDLYTTEEHSPESKVLYDRIFIDAPSSNDGTLRKNYFARANWSISKAQKSHKDLKEMLRRGVELLEMEGQLVFSTQSLNPVENEAVVAAVLKEAKGAVELVDVRKKTPDFHSRPGMASWKVMSQGLVLYDTFESCPAWFKKENEETMFPPLEEDIPNLKLERCMRVLPHDNDTSGFFCAVLTKVDDLPWQKEGASDAEEMEDAQEVKVKEEPGDKEVAAVKMEVEEGADAKKEESKAPPYTRPIKVDINVCVSQIEWETELTDQNMDTVCQQETHSFILPPMKIAKTCVPAWLQKKRDSEAHLNQDVTAEDPAWLHFKKLFDIKRFDPTANIVKFTEQHKNFDSYFYVCSAVKNLVKCNPAYVTKAKNHNFGLFMIRSFDTGSFDMTVFGYVPLLAHMGRRVIQVTRDDMVTLLQARCVLNKNLSDKVQRDLNVLGGEKGPVFFVYEPKGKNPDPKCAIIQRRETYKGYVKEVVTMRGEKAHVHRLLGIDPVEKNDAEADEAEEMN